MSNQYQNRVNNQVIIPVQRFIQHEKSGGIVLGISVIIALFLANSPWAAQYFHFFEQKIGFIVNDKSYLNFDLHHWINDGLMAMFFFVVGLELKREFIAGELSNIRKAILPIGAAIGGMVIPAFIYLFFNSAEPAAKGWGIPMATDIAFALGVLYLLGNKVPLSIKIFLTALAIVDDLGAVLVIAFFYTSNISILNLGIGLVFVLTMFVANKIGIKNVIFYAVLGIGGVWMAFLLSGVHATIAAVLAAFMIPVDSRINENTYIDSITKLLRRFKEVPPNDNCTLENEQVDILDRIKEDTNLAIPPLQRLEHAMHSLVAFIIMPIFALANAGVSFANVNFTVLFSTNIVLGVALGLLLGKVIGVVGTSIILIKLKIATPPTGMTKRKLLGIGFLAAIGFTMSMFITTLAFTDPTHLVQAKIGIFTASIIGGMVGYCLLKK
jgi:Na+/H+ antiporter NhaA